MHRNFPPSRPSSSALLSRMSNVLLGLALIKRDDSPLFLCTASTSLFNSCRSPIPFLHVANLWLVGLLYLLPDFSASVRRLFSAFSAFLRFRSLGFKKRAFFRISWTIPSFSHFFLKRRIALSIGSPSLTFTRDILLSQPFIQSAAESLPDKTPRRCGGIRTAC